MRHPAREAELGDTVNGMFTCVLQSGFWSIEAKNSHATAVINHTITYSQI